MARLKHQPTRPDSGFSPIQLGRGEISRMREETNRVVQNMEKNRLAQLEQGKANLQALRDNADYTRRAEERNFQIQQQNLQDRSSFKVNLMLKQLKVKQMLTPELLNRSLVVLSGFSQTAAEASKRKSSSR
jgi:hypothetical protein